METVKEESNEVWVKIRPVLEVPIDEAPQVMGVGKYKVECYNTDDGKTMCRLTKEGE